MENGTGCDWQSDLFTMEGLEYVLGFFSIDFFFCKNLDSIL